MSTLEEQQKKARERKKKGGDLNVMKQKTKGIVTRRGNRDDIDREHAKGPSRL